MKVKMSELKGLHAAGPRGGVAAAEPSLMT